MRNAHSIATSETATIAAWRCCYSVVLKRIKAVILQCKAVLPKVVDAKRNGFKYGQNSLYHDISLIRTGKEGEHVFTSKKFD